MNFPSLNTDSFYKFITILSLLCIVFSSKMIGDRFQNNRKIKLEFYTDSLTLSNEIKTLKLEIENSKYLKPKNILDSLKIRTDSIKNTNLIDLKNGIIYKLKTEKEDSEFYLDFTVKLYTVIFLSGFFGLIFGFVNWYDKQQSLRDKEILRDYINLGRISMTCGSCGKIMNKDTIRPKEKDDSFNYDFCTDCYENGEFTEPKLTVEEMKNKIKLKSKYRLKRWWNLLYIDKLKRWK